MLGIRGCDGRVKKNKDVPYIAMAARIAQVVHSGRRVKTIAIITEVATKYPWFTLSGAYQKMETKPTMAKFQITMAAVIQSTGKFNAFISSLKCNIISRLQYYLNEIMFRTIPKSHQMHQVIGNMIRIARHILPTYNENECYTGTKLSESKRTFRHLYLYRMTKMTVTITTAATNMRALRREPKNRCAPESVGLSE